ncbi:histidine phosphatase family protein [Desulfosarcina sp.]|nr:histidine phosphatase family protein [Desulfosarcina sp.]
MNFKNTSWLLLFFSLLAIAGKSQDNNLHELKQFYKNQDSEKPLELYSDSISEILQIILIRHGEPDLNKKGWRNRNEAIQFMKDYDSAIVKPLSKKPLSLGSIPVDTIFHSTLPRAENTAQRTFGDIEFLVGSSDFVEFERQAMKWPNMKMPIKFWTTGSRILWMMGLNDKNIESFSRAKKRAIKNTLFLSSEAENNGIVILVAHGLHNKYLKKFLRKSDWEIVFNNGNDYLSVKILAKDPNIKKTKRKRTIYDKCDCS